MVRYPKGGLACVFTEVAVRRGRGKTRKMISQRAATDGPDAAHCDGTAPRTRRGSERWSRLGGGEVAHAAALTLFESGLRGVDPARNAAIDEMDRNLEPRRATARLWPQTERLKAALLLRREDEACAAAEGLWQYLQTPLTGLWRDKMLQDGSFVEEPAPASSLYHIICAVASLKAYEVP